jgi:hypothetical protein
MRAAFTLPVRADGFFVPLRDTSGQNVYGTAARVKFMTSLGSPSGNEIASFTGA